MTKPIVDVDTQNTDPKYWDRVLQSHGLGMNVGSRMQTSMVGSNHALVRVEENQIRRESGAVRPSGVGPIRGSGNGEGRG